MPRAILYNSQQVYSGGRAAEEEIHSLYKAMEQLTERQREIVRLHYFDELDQKKIAELLGIRQQNVSKNLIRAIEKLKKVSEGWV